MSAWRTHRTSQLAALRGGGAVRLAGRVQRGAQGLELVDANGVCAVSAHAALCVDDLVSVTGTWDGTGVVVAEVVVLAHPTRPVAEDPEHARLASPSLRTSLAQVATARAALRRYFAEQDFVEVETGTFTDEPGQEPYLEPLRLERVARYAITSPELRLKRLLSAGFERVVEIGRVVRGGLGERSERHHPEFALAEWYRAYEDDEALITDLERVFERCARAATGRAEFVRGGRVARLDRGFERISVAAAFALHAGVDLDPFLHGDVDGFKASARAAGVAEVHADTDAETLFFRILLDRVEPRLGIERPTILHSYPASMAALARLDPDDARVAQRFECYALGVELANAFVELTDPNEQRARFEHERIVRAQSGREELPLPRRFLAALERGLPPCAGVALGLERVWMLILGKDRIDDVLAFPEPRDAVW
ncbi:MAG: EF-P lysine aminoacylase GenX [Planctomycetes bacterium]|nr:EF-P lysine aminoacylase GenX [Planctomycetota bacterium]MCC7169999.1 EF-P lysine aminoacylase GenX [Planctomycetota bacterium]